MHYLIKDTEFENFLKIISKIKGLHSNNIENLRNFLEATCYMAKAGCPWRLLPKEYGFYRAVHRRFKRWSDMKIWEQIFEALKQNPDMEYTMIDSTIVRAHACAAGYEKDSQNQEALGRSRGGFTTKIHALCDALGNPLKFILTPGQHNDITQAQSLTENISDMPLIADKGYDSDEFRTYLKNKNCSPVIPPKENRLEQYEYDKYLYEDRNRIEGFFGKAKHFRRVFSRFDKTAQSFLSFVQFVGAMIWVR
jgi:transposase